MNFKMKLLMLFVLFIIGLQAECPCDNMWLKCYIFGHRDRTDICKCINETITCIVKNECGHQLIDDVHNACYKYKCSSCPAQQICMHHYLDCARNTREDDIYFCYCTGDYGACLHAWKQNDTLGILSRTCRLNSCEWC